jgi:hypothetical protein
VARESLRIQPARGNAAFHHQRDRLIRQPPPYGPEIGSA